LTKGKGDLGDQSKGKRGTLIKEDIGRSRREVFGKEGGFRGSKIIKASWTRVLFDDDVVFH
jgi:hypothetical protein